MAPPENQPPGRLVIISGPSGVGKTTVVKRLLADCDLPLVLSVSATTRQQRDGEVDGSDYHFLSTEEFHRRQNEGHFLESCEVFGRGHWYGTLKKTVASSLQLGKWVILEIDVQGAMKVLEQVPDAITVFIGPESLEELEQRLRGRGTESEDKIQKRLATAKHELEFADRYRHRVVNRSVDETVACICQILKSQGA